MAEKKSKPSQKSSQPYKRQSGQSEAQMAEIVREIPQVCCLYQYGLNRNAIKLCIIKQSTRGIPENHFLDLTSITNENQKSLSVIFWT